MSATDISSLSSPESDATLLSPSPPVPETGATSESASPPPLVTTTVPNASCGEGEGATDLKRKKQKISDNGTANEETTKKKQPDFLLIDDINEGLVTGNIDFDTDRCLPATVKSNPLTGTISPVWGFYHRLEVPIHKHTHSENKAFGMNKVKATKVKVFTHLCLECLKEVESLGDIRKVINTSNAENHLKSKHGKIPAVIEFLEEKERKAKSKGAFDSGVGEDKCNM